MRIRSRIFASAAVAIVGLGLITGPAAANHSWGGYHWARQTSSFSLRLGDNVSSTWDTYLRNASADWSQSSVIDTVVSAGLDGGNVKRCQARTGRVEVCNAKYGYNGWLGVASVSISGSHIVAGTTKMNDTYFASASYNTPAERQFVMCQEVGHTFGLDHQDENFSPPNLGTCMDYTNDPTGSGAYLVANTSPNAHDYEELETIYAHLDSTTTVGSSTASVPANASGNSKAEWGRAIRTDAKGRPDLFVQDHGGGRKTFTFVIWA